MTSNQLNAAVARATGEDLEVIAERGFNLVDDQPPTSNEEWMALALDWDDLEQDWRGDDRLLLV